MGRWGTGAVKATLPIIPRPVPGSRWQSNGQKVLMHPLPVRTRWLFLDVWNSSEVNWGRLDAH